MVQVSEQERPIDRLLAIMARLRDPVCGCPWDREQTFSTISPYTVEEAYEVADAIERGDLEDLRDELGDLLLQVVFHARIAEEQGSFAFDDVVQAICDKMIRRHPHVFNAPRDGVPTPPVSSWEGIKSQERATKGGAEGTLSGVPTALPALTRAVKLSKRAAAVGFVWATTDAVLEKVREELGELEAEIKSGDLAKAHEELGDLLFVCANLARDLNIDPEAALQAANAKFVRRFSYVEQSLAKAGLTPMDAGLEEMERLWNVVRAADKAGRQPV